jgi:hypothetical protein
MLTILGLFAVTAMLVFYALEDQSPSYIVAFAGACALGSAYGFLQGAWPFMGWRSSVALASKGEECLEVAKARSDLPDVIGAVVMARICLFRGRTGPAILPRNCYRFSTVKGKIARQAVPAALCAVTSPPRRCVLASAETLRGRQCPFPLYDASQIPLLQHRAPGPIPPAGTSLARPTKHPEARQISFFARRSLVPSLIGFPPAFAGVNPGYATATGRRSIARKPVRGRHRISCSGTASASFGQRRNSAFNAHDPSMRAS